MYVREAIESGGLALDRQSFAKDYGPSLEKAGFQALPRDESRLDKLGDVAVIQPAPGHPFGHMCMWDGHDWISDFIQQTMYPGSAYRAAQPPYVIYRYWAE